MEITEKQIKELHELSKMFPSKETLTKKIEEWFPECFKPKYEIGKWYKSGKSIINYQGVTNAYGYYAECDKWEDVNDSWLVFEEEGDKLSLATTEEVESMLIKEAEERGLVDGVTLAKEGINSNFSFVFKPIFGYKFLPKMNILDSAGGYGHIFNNGKWATIVETPKEMTLEEIEKQLGHKIKIVS